VNLLLQTEFYIDESGEHNNLGASLIRECIGLEEMDLFKTPALQSIIQYKWDTYGRQHHLIGMYFHFVYTALIMVYVSQSYMVESENQEFFAVILALGIVYPAAYDILQLYRDGVKEYFEDSWNYFDFLYIYGSFANIVCQVYFGPYHIASRVLMMCIVLMLISKTFFFLRVFPLLTPIVVMLIDVINDLKVFMLFYFILVLGFS